MADEAMDVDGDAGTQSHGGGFEWAVPDDELDFQDSTNEDFSGRDSLIYAVDFSDMMFQLCKPKKSGDTSKPKTAVHTALQAIREAVISRIYRSEQDFLAIIFYNTSRGYGTSFKHIFVADDVQRPGAEVVKKLNKMLDMDNDELKAEFGVSNNCSIGDLLWACNSVFSTISQKLFSKRVQVFTVNDDPHKGNRQLVNFAKQKGTDVWENGISITVFALDLPDHTFDQSKFWDLIMIAGDDEDQRVAQLGDWEDLTSAIRRKDHAKRAMARLPLVLGDGLELGISVYTLVRTATKAPAIKLHSGSNEQVTAETTSMEEVGATILMPTDFKKYMTFAGRNLYFNLEEVDEMKRFGTPGLKVIAFKSLDFLKEKHHIRPAQFIYPDEHSVLGSTKLFIALLMKCLEKKLMALCQYIPRENIAPKYVGLVPQEEELSEDETQITPPGFHIVFFPFADDFRSNLPKPKDAPVADKEAIEKAKELIKKLKFSYNPENFSNPVLQTHLKNIEALALQLEVENEEGGVKVEDFTEPKTAAMEKRAGKLMAELVDLVYPSNYDPLAGVAKKRAYEPKEKKAPVKKGPAAPGDGAGDADITAAAESGTLKKLTVAILKAYCQKHKIKPEGTKKDDLIGAIETHLAGND